MRNSDERIEFPEAYKHDIFQMKIIHKIDDFLFSIFPKLSGGGNELIINALENYYTYGPFKPRVTIENDWVTVDIDAPTIAAQEADFKKTTALCDMGRFSEAKPILQKLLEKNPTNSEYHRIMGQILSEEGDQKEAINCLIDALRWDSKNGWALLMMGNIYTKYKNDIPTAMKFFDHALEANPDDYLTINNIAANLMQQGKTVEAKKYFIQVLKINSEYPNAHYALGRIEKAANDLHPAFYNTLAAIRYNKSRDTLYQHSLSQAFEIAKSIIQTGDARQIFNEYRHKLEFEGGKEIDVVEDNEMPTAAKIEFAEYYGRPKHIVRFKPDYPAVEHLIMHELVHLDFVIQARKGEINQLFLTTQKHQSEFTKGLDLSIRKFQRMGIEEEAIANYINGIFEGLNSQVYNAPIDLFIENLLYQDFAELRPYQFVSLYGIIQEGIKAVTDKKIVEHSPKDILSKSKVYNLVNALQYKDLFGIDLLKDFYPTSPELKQARTFYDEYLDYKNDKAPAEEYELIENWAKDLNIDKFFELVDEIKYRAKNADLQQVLDSIENDPLGLVSMDPHQNKEVEKFRKTQAQIGTNMAIVMFMVDAMDYFKGKPKADVKKIAHEIAWQGTQGYDPKKENYRISAIPGKLFSGYHILAYYYVSWVLTAPDLIPQLNIPFDKEYQIALTIYKPEQK